MTSTWMRSTSALINHSWASTCPLGRCSWMSWCCPQDRTQLKCPLPREARIKYQIKYRWWLRAWVGMRSRWGPSVYLKTYSSQGEWTQQGSIHNGSLYSIILMMMNMMEIWEKMMRMLLEYNSNFIFKQKYCLQLKKNLNYNHKYHLRKVNKLPLRAQREKLFLN